MEIRAGNGGWHRVVTDLGLPGVVYFRVQEVDGALRMTELYVDGRGVPIQAGALRKLPVGALEQLAAAVPTARERLRTVAPDLSRLAAHYATTFGSKARHWVADSMRAQMAGHPDAPPQAPMPTSVGGVAPEIDLEIRLSPPTEGLTPGFFQDLARAYEAAVAQGLPPATAIAEVTGYERRTVESWIYRARKRGLMPPALKKGRVV